MFSNLFRQSRTSANRRNSSFATNFKHQTIRLRQEAQIYYLAVKHPQARWDAKVVAVCCAGYVFSPIQLIPSFIPVIGFLDDFLVLFLGAKLLKRILPPDVLAECREHAKAAELRRRDEIRLPAAVTR